MPARCLRNVRVSAQRLRRLRSSRGGCVVAGEVAQQPTGELGFNPSVLPLDFVRVVLTFAKEWGGRVLQRFER